MKKRIVILASQWAGGWVHWLPGGTCLLLADACSTLASTVASAAPNPNRLTVGCGWVHWLPGGTCLLLADACSTLASTVASACSSAAPGSSPSASARSNSTGSWRCTWSATHRPPCPSITAYSAGRSPRSLWCISSTSSQGSLLPTRWYDSACRQAAASSLIVSAAPFRANRDSKPLRSLEGGHGETRQAHASGNTWRVATHRHQRRATSWRLRPNRSHLGVA
jgi:hypothetical protein